MKYRATVYLLLHSKLKTGKYARRWKRQFAEEFECKARALEWVKRFSTVKSTKVTLQKLGGKHGKR